MTKSVHRAVFYSVLGLGFILVLLTTRSSLLPAMHNKTKADDRITKTLRFDVEPADLVAMTISDTSRYELSEAGKLDYSRLMPTGGHTVHISTPNESVPRTYTVALFHQLKCLEIYHREYLKPLPHEVTAELRGCLNYLRQTLLCHADTRLESIKNGEVQASKQYDTVCRDWTKVYDAAEENYDDYQSRPGRMENS